MNAGPIVMTVEMTVEYIFSFNISYIINKYLQLNVNTVSVKLTGGSIFRLIPMIIVYTLL